MRSAVVVRYVVIGLVLLALVLPGPAEAWSWPVDGPVLRSFSFDSSQPYAGGQHRGIDIGAATGTPAVAPAAGVVSFAGSVPTNGLTVTIRTADGYSVTLVHLGSIAVRDGSSVAEGAVAGTVGPSGTPELAVPYLYLGVRRTSDPNGYVDPLSLLPPRSQTPPPPPTLADPVPAPAPVAAPPAPAPTADAAPSTAGPPDAADRAPTPEVPPTQATPAPTALPGGEPVPHAAEP